MAQAEGQEKKLLVFLSHASEDKPKVRRLCQRLRADGFDPWLDEERLLPGQEWSLEIEKAMRGSGAILLCFSARSAGKEGYIQREYKRAMQFREEKPEGTIFVIPVRLDGCELPFFTRELQWVDYPAGYERLVQALNQRAGKTSPQPAKKEEKKMPARKKPASRPTYHIEGGIHADKVVMGDQTITAGRDVILGDQTNITYHFPEPRNAAEFIQALQLLQAQLAAAKGEAVNSIQENMIASAAQKVAEAAREAGSAQPPGERIKAVLGEAKEYMDAIQGSLQSAAGLGATIGTLILAAVKLFGM